MALRTMQEDPKICGAFKKEEPEYNKAIENLVRTECAKSIQGGIEKFYIETGVDEYNVLTTKDEKVCLICGGEVKNNLYKLSEAIINGNRVPFHGRCRRTGVPNMPKSGKDVGGEYERLFGDLSDELAHNSSGINLKRRRWNEKSF